MPVKKDASGHRYVEAEVEVPGTPEEVWRAIANGPGISSWFVPSEVEEREGGTAVAHFGPGNSMDSVGKISKWEPPHRFVIMTDELGEGAPPVASEWTVEARTSGTAVVRVVHRWFAQDDAWDNQFESHESAWPDFFRILRLYLTYFRGQASSAFQIMGVAPEPATGAWNRLIEALGSGEPVVAGSFRTSGASPVLSGIVERVGEPGYHQLLLRLEQPAPGVAHLFALPMDGRVYLAMRVYLYGDRADGVVAREEPLWHTWMGERFGEVESGASAGE